MSLVISAGSGKKGRSNSINFAGSLSESRSVSSSSTDVSKLNVELSRSVNCLLQIHQSFEAQRPSDTDAYHPDAGCGYVELSLDEAYAAQVAVPDRRFRSSSLTSLTDRETKKTFKR